MKRSTGSALSAVALLVLAISPAKAIETVTVTAQRQAQDPCLAIATAKYSQWSQARIFIRETRTFPDGRASQSQIIFTPGTVYSRTDGLAWTSRQLTQRQHAAASPEDVEKAMGFAACRIDRQTEEAGVPVTAYAFSYPPDASGNQATGEIWIADESGLPVRQELHQKPPPEHAAAEISVRYAYGDDVTVPLAAENADSVRRWRTAQWLRDIQEGRPAWGP